MRLEGRHEAAGQRTTTRRETAKSTELVNGHARAGARQQGRGGEVAGRAPRDPLTGDLETLGGSGGCARDTSTARDCGGQWGQWPGRCRGGVAVGSWGEGLKGGGGSVGWTRRG